MKSTLRNSMSVSHCIEGERAHGPPVVKWLEAVNILAIKRCAACLSIYNYIKKTTHTHKQFGPKI